jgi:broad specificity phosphatase PhoE
VSDRSPNDNPLVGRVDALLRRHQQGAPGGADDVPVLTEVVEPASQAAEALARELERSVLQRLERELQPLLAAALHEAVAAAVKRELEARELDAGALAGKRPPGAGA